MTDASERPVEPQPVLSGEGPALLAYGRSPRRKRGLRVLLTLFVVSSLSVGAYYAWRELASYLQWRADYAKVDAWYQVARRAVLPEGTILVDRTPKAIEAARINRHPGLVGEGLQQSWSLYRGNEYPLLQEVIRNRRGLWLAPDTFIIYAQEHVAWRYPSGTQPYMLTLNAYARSNESVGFMIRGTAFPFTRTSHIPHILEPVEIAQDDREPLKHLRIFAGRPDPGHANRFSLPFDCLAGRGRFLFELELETNEEGRFAKEVRIVWDERSTTQPTINP